MKILLVEDNSDDAEFLRACLAHYNRSTTLTRAGLISDAVTALTRELMTLQVEGDYAKAKEMLTTLGNVTSNANPSGRGLNPEFLTRHEGLHIWQARLFGPFLLCLLSE